ncbi:MULTISPECIES: carbon-nitrogen hydrolase family protein [unclassified Pseudoxanthomonas]|uniref:carbon-nitrogen hydrolase family protein n=1 Tax=unclassified Pseudoxanthomonas TaxID=2645906 RepID=UPI0008EE6878|nr:MULTISPECIES: carbon-nitrogen hydrolase family protein [unclassified Pseudoxanthomonas]PPJ42280.1 nitrilase [Pseudoxanthomonas sp. KAs_5_3]SFV27920.1 Predicted amidohydrolase [Pseudoxanthomonas sp. YR558]
MKVAVAKYPIQAPGDFAAFAERQAAVLGEAAAQGARVAVLPEYLSLELAATFEADTQADLHASLAAIQRYRDDWLALYARLATSLDMYIVAGTFLLAQGDGRYRNRCDVFTPQGAHLWQDKLQLTGFEKGLAVIDGGDALKVFDLDGVRTGVAVCYDSEFPLPVRAQAEAGARLLLVPSCTDTEAGATRVRVGCLARALENRVFVAQSVTACEAAWSPALDINTGEAAIFAPMDRGLPADGVVAQTSGDEVWTLAELDFDALERSRGDAQVANDRDWAGQLQPAITRARMEKP